LASELDNILEMVADGDLEEFMDRLRQYHHAQTFKVAALDIHNVLEVTDVGEALSHIAEIILVKALEVAWNSVCESHGKPGCFIDGKEFYPEMAIVAYGKLGGEELGYSSDLDIVFLHNSSGDQQVTNGAKAVDNTVFFNRVAQRVLHILGTRTYAGLLYETDIRLRPDGRAGLMVSGLQAFEEYQQNKAWTWEHQALLKARVVTSSDHVRQEFARIRCSVLANQRDKDKLCHDVAEMRAKMRHHLGGGNEQGFNIKQDAGGMVDIEFLVQAGVLLYAMQSPALLETTSTLLFFAPLVEVGWIKQAESDELMSAYRDYRQQVNRQALEVRQSEQELSDLLLHREKVSRIWNRLMPVIE